MSSLVANHSKSINAKDISFTNILVVGGSYAGISFLKGIVNQVRKENKRKLDSKLNNKKLLITMVEPRCGLLNIIGLPRSILDVEFAKSQFLSFRKINLMFDNIYNKYGCYMNNQKPVDSFKHQESSLTLNHIQGKVIHLDNKLAEYVLDENGPKKKIYFDYVVLATGRDRNSPITPKANTGPMFVKEMSDFNKTIEKYNIISIIGGGAVDVEIAANIKKYFPKKNVNIIHPHYLLPPEPLSCEFKDSAYRSLVDAGINVILGTRILRECDNGNLETNNGEIITSEFNFWSNSAKNNLDLLSDEIKNQFLTKQNNVLVNEYLQMSNSDSTISNFFCIGDIVDLQIIKTAGWAIYMGKQTAVNLCQIILENKQMQSMPDLKQFPRGMVLVSGNNTIISVINDNVEINNEVYVKEYNDYLLQKVLTGMEC